MGHRIIITGKNSELPRFVSIPMGVLVDGTVLKARFRINPGETICSDCKGYGEHECSVIDPSVKDWTERCTTCDGNGVISAEVEA